MRSLCVPAWCLAAGLAAGAQALEIGRAHV